MRQSQIRPKPSLLPVGMKPRPTRDKVKVVILQRVRRQFEWQVRCNEVVLAKGVSGSVAQARLDGEAAIPRAIRQS
jgi:hypothetical protein